MNTESRRDADENSAAPEAHTINVKAESPSKILEQMEVVEVTEVLEEFDPDSIVEAAEALLREGAPHDFDLLVVGSGPGGYAAALRAAQLGGRVGLIEAREPGGTSVNRGGVPTLALLESAAALRAVRRAGEFGIELEGGAQANLDVIQKRKASLVAKLRERVWEDLKDAGVRIIPGHARFVEEHTLEVEDSGEFSRYNAVHVLIATGGLTRRPGIPGHDLPGVLTTDEALELRTIPSKIVILGAGVLALEFATLFQQLGSECTLLHGAERLLPKEDEELARGLEAGLRRGGVMVQLKATIERIERVPAGLAVHYERDDIHYSTEAPIVLIAGGRQPNIADLGLDKAGIQTENGKIVVEEDFGTSVSGVYAVGDCIRSLGWAHQAAAEGRAVAERLLGEGAPDLPPVPHCYHTAPEAASVGLTLAWARDFGLDADSCRSAFQENTRAVLEGNSEGFVKLVFETVSERLLGCQIVGPKATEMIHLAAQALQAGWTLEELIRGVHTFPAAGEVLSAAALAARRSWPGDW